MVCIVDDDESVCRAIGRVVEEQGFEIQLFNSGRECLEAPDIVRASVLVIDVTMPELDGFELHVLLLAAKRNIPMIFMSAFDIVSFRRRAEQAGAEAFLGKPCDDADLLNAIHEAVGR